AEWLEAGGCPLGIMAMMKYDESRNQLGPGDGLVVFSEGVTDADDPEENEFGEQRLAAAVRDHRTESSAAILESVNRAIADWAQGTPLPDDLTLLVARRAGELATGLGLAFYAPAFLSHQPVDDRPCRYPCCGGRVFLVRPPPDRGSPRF